MIKGGNDERPEVKVQEERQEVAYANVEVGQLADVKIELDVELFPRIIWAALAPHSKTEVVSERQPKQKYLRIANNSHKKYISAAKRALLQLLSSAEVADFELKYDRFKTARSYFFIILAHARWRLGDKMEQFQSLFKEEVSLKILECQKESQKTENQNLRHFREKETTEMQYALMAIEQFLYVSPEEAVEIMYKRGDAETFKKQNYLNAIKLVRNLENQLSKGDSQGDSLRSWEEEGESQSYHDGDDADDKELSSEEEESNQSDYVPEGEKRQKKARRDSPGENKEGSQQMSEEGAVDPFLIYSGAGAKGKPLYPSQAAFKLRKGISDLLPL